MSIIERYLVNRAINQHTVRFQTYDERYGQEPYQGIEVQEEMRLIPEPGCRVANPAPSPVPVAKASIFI